MPQVPPSLLLAAQNPRVRGLVAGAETPARLSDIVASRDASREQAEQQNTSTQLQNRQLQEKLDNEPVLQAIRKKAAAGDKMAQIELASVSPEDAFRLSQITKNANAQEVAALDQQLEAKAAQAIAALPTASPQQRPALIRDIAMGGFMKEAIALGQTKPGEGQFTLGNKRFGPSGNVIASVEGKPEKVTAKNVKLDDGRVVAATVSPDGTVKVGTRELEPGSFSFISQQATGAPGDFQGTKSQVGKDIRQLDFIDRSIEQIDSIIAAVEADPTLVGVPGAIRRAGQTITGGIADVKSVLTGSEAAQAETDPVSQIAQSLLEETELSAEEKQSFFNDPDISKLRLYENTVGLALARTRHPDGRVPVDIIKRSIADAKLTGFTSSRDVINRLREIKEGMTSVKSGLSTRTNRPNEQTVKPIGEMTDEEIQAEIDRIKGTQLGNQ